TESWGMWQSESMLCGTPVVAPDLPGVRESVRVTGMGELVRPHDPAGTADALARVMLNRERYTQPKRDPHEVFRPERTIDAYERWYTELLSAPRRRMVSRRQPAPAPARPPVASPPVAGAPATRP
ncbi:MAG TPA: glycosyltransferase, partial [Chloroflexota bacterium]|nr:glycosyltransferase [Chloroflexota bacterium]